MEQTIEIDVRAIFMALVRKLWLVVLLAGLGGVVLYAYTANFVTPMYTAKVSIYVNNSVNTGGNSGISSSDLTTSQKLVKTYVNMIKSDTVLEKVAETTGLNITANQIRGMLTAKSIDNTEMFNVEITNADPVKAQLIANAVAQVAPGEIANFVEGSSTKIIDYARVPTTPVSPDTMKNTLLGAAAGALVAIVFTVLQVLMDVRIKSEEDLKRISSAPVLGTIPDFSQDDRGGYSRYGYGYGYTSQQKKSTDGKEGQ